MKRKSRVLGMVILKRILVRTGKEIRGSNYNRKVGKSWIIARLQRVM